MADRVGREEGWQAAEREAGGVGDSYNAADESGVGIVAGGAGGERRAAERPSGGGVGGEGVRGMRLGVGSAVVVTRGRNGCVRGMEPDAGGRGQARVGEAFAEQSAGRGTRWWCARPRQGGNGRGLLSRRAVTLVGLPGVGSALGLGRGSARPG